MKEIKRSALNFNMNLKQISREGKHADHVFPCGFRVRVNVHTGFWWCNSCVGKTEGSELIQPNCDYCQIY